MTVEWNFASAGRRSPTRSRTGPRSSRATASGAGASGTTAPHASPRRSRTSGSPTTARSRATSTTRIEYMEGVFATWKCGGAPGQRQLPLPRGRARLPPHQLRHRDPALPRLARRPGRQGRRPDPDAQGDRPGRRRLAAPRGRAPLRGPDRLDEPDATRRDAPATTSTSSTPAAPPGCPRASCGATRTCSCRSSRSSTGSRARRSPRRDPRARPPSRPGPRPGGRTPVHLPASPLMHGTGFMSSLQALTMGGTIVTLESRHFDADELWRAVERNRRDADGDRRRRVRQADGRARSSTRRPRASRTTCRRSASSSARASCGRPRSRRR